MDFATFLQIFAGPLGFLIGVLSGVAANFIGKFIWRWYTMPQLEFDPTSQANFVTDDSGTPIARVFRVRVENTGKKAATNCKPEMSLIGVLNNSRFEIDCPLYWEDEDSSSRITINPGERAAFDVFRIIAEEEGGVVQTGYKFYVEFPADAGWTSTKNVVKWGLDERGDISGADFPDKIEKQYFRKIGWESNSIQVTSENAKTISGSLSLAEKQGEQGELVGLTMEIEAD